MLPEMVDVGVAEMAEAQDLRAAVAEARRASDLLHGPAWPVETGSLAEAVYWYRQLAGQGDYTRPEHVIAALSNLGYAWRTDRRWAEAETAFRECVQLCRQRGDRAGMRQTFFDLGSLYQAQERWTDAESALAQSLEIAREIGDRRGTANALGSLGAVYAELGQNETAIRRLQEAVVVANEIADEALAERMRQRMTRLNH
jgi:tetratricopeptide (TPR) repeat protein